MKLQKAWTSQLTDYGYGNLSIAHIEEHNKDYYKYKCFDISGEYVYRYAILPESRKSYEESGKQFSRFFQDANVILPALYIYDIHALLESISRSNANLILTEGTTDAQTLITNGFGNVSAFWSTGQKLDQNVVSTIQSLGAKTVYFYHHKDNAGLSFAKTIKEFLSNHAINCHIMTIPTGQKDLRDLFIHECNYDPQQLFHALSGSLQAELPKEDWHNTVKSDKLSVTFYNLILDQLGIDTSSTNMRGWAKNVKCPVVNHERDDVAPAFAYNVEEAWGYCYKCRKSYTAATIAKQFGIDINQYANQVPQENKITEPQFKMLSASVTEHYNRIIGVSRSQYKPIRNPIGAFANLGGAGKYFHVPSIMLISGMSGGYKTSLMRHMLTCFTSKDFGGLYAMEWSPEWTPERRADRLMQDFGGLSMSKVRETEVYWHYKDDPYMLKQYEIDTERIHDGEVYSRGAINQYNRVITGDVALLSPPALTWNTLRDQIVTTYESMSVSGIRPTVLTIDYIQLLAETQNMTHNMMLFGLKELSIQLGLFVIVNSQVTKDAARNVLKNISSIDQTSSLGISDMASNFGVTIQPHLVDGRASYFEYSGTKYKVLSVNVVKNTDGSSNFNENEIFLFVDTKRGCIVENPKDPDSILYYIDSNDKDLGE